MATITGLTASNIKSEIVPHTERNCFFVLKGMEEQ